MSDLVSVIIPTYNRPRHLDRAIKSVLDQTYKDIEIIIVDDNGDNFEVQQETKLLIDKFSSEYSNIKYIKNICNLGGAESRNEGVKFAKGQYISFLDDDDAYEVNNIYEQMRVLKSDNTFDVCYCGMNYLDSKGKHIGQRKIYLEGSEELIGKHLFRPITGTPTLLIKKNAFEKVNGFDKLKRYQDANLIFKLLAFKCKFTSVKKELINVYIHNDERISTSGNALQLERDYIKNSLKYIDMLSYKNSKRLLEKYHILNCIIENKSAINRIVNITKTIKFKIFSTYNLFSIANYIKKGHIQEIIIRREG